MHSQTEFAFKPVSAESMSQNWKKIKPCIDGAEGREERREKFKRSLLRFNSFYPLLTFVPSDQITTISNYHTQQRQIWIYLEVRHFSGSCVHGRPPLCSFSIKSSQITQNDTKKNPLKYLAVLTKLNKNIPVKIRLMCTMEAFPHRLSPSAPLLWRMFWGKFCSWGEQLEDSGQLQIDIILELPRRE